jgi:hypothetical protein
MHKEILSEEQLGLFPLLQKFENDFGLVGGTAIALHLGHRRSIDYDLFSENEFRNITLERDIREVVRVERVLVNRGGELTFVSSGVKVTFFQYPFHIAFDNDFEGIIRLPELLTLAAMKAFAVGKRAKWKDYVDLYFLLKDHYSLQDIILRSKEIFGSEFNEKIFRTQLSYFDDINYDESVEFMPGFSVGAEEIKSELTRLSLGE